jgi:hypothetical protein
MDWFQFLLSLRPSPASVIIAIVVFLVVWYGYRITCAKPPEPIVVDVAGK